MVEFNTLNPYPWYRLMRQSQPVFRNTELIPKMPVWEIFKYDDVLTVLNNPKLFSSNIYVADPVKSPFKSSIVFMDPPQHQQMRSLVSSIFSAKNIQKLENRVAVIANQLIDRKILSGAMDVIDDFAYPLPSTIITEMLGVPNTDQQEFRKWSEAYVNPLIRYDTSAMFLYFQDLIISRRKKMKNDIISTLIQQQLTDKDIQGFCALLLVAGNATTIHLIGNAFRCFNDYPNTFDELKNNPSVLPATIEEILRYRSPTHIQLRIALTNTTIEKQEIKAGEIIVPNLGSANRDELHFVNPDSFDIKRIPNQHLAFGKNIHFCLGATLARLEARIALTIISNRIKSFQLTTSELESVGPALHGVKHFPIQFDYEY